ncbi:hypothetical protein [Flavobacterium sp. HBTb2-11-1]|uniref:hypothetical protein n=1 Tax=Flavobacterium sp. HBTb2-11-1 TaxID=2692212 RepID=UPI001367C0E1|nr:hypothetical protein [Flavobacterium sp. HBTb2-11-1]MXO04212.1 hypothetical protein [Flavobacterium sp. HBTb2-11-1]
MTETIIENLKVLSDNFKYKFDTLSSSIIFVNEINRIRIWVENDSAFKISYNLGYDEETLLVSEETVYHFCINLFKRKNNDIGLIPSNYKSIDIDEWFKIEEREALGIASVTQKELEYNYRLKHLFLESKRFDITYFNGLLILEDKKKEYLSNVFDFKDINPK